MTVTVEAEVYRRAESQDIERIIEMAYANVSDEEYKKKIVHDIGMLRFFVGSVLADSNARAFVYESDGTIEGIFAFTTQPNFYYFGGQLTANMVIWSVSKEFRGRVSIRLLSLAQREAREMGVKRMIMTGPNDSFGELAEHCGFEFLESAFMKEL